MQIESVNKSLVSFGEKSYQLLNNTLRNQLYSKIFVITDSNTSEYCLPYFLSQLQSDIATEIIEIEAGEENKNIETCQGVWQSLSEMQADRKSVIIALGGGVVTDLSGFVASTFKRGIDYISVPTSLLAMVDASVGGKTGVDLGPLKNEVGTFYLPQLVIIDTLYLETLPQIEMQSGLAEMFKHGLIADYDYWKKLTNLSKLTTDDLEQLIYRSVEIKNDIVLSDPTEKHDRKKLNFGHTIGHAIESYFLHSQDKEPIKHGFAVAYGMVIEAEMSYQQNLINQALYEEIKTVLTNFYGELPLSEQEYQDCLQYLKHDKKNEKGKILFTLLDGKGSAKVNCSID